MLTQDQFLTQLRSALNHLYDPEELRRNSLAELLGVAGQINAHLALQRRLIDAIEALKPPAGGERQPGKDSQAHELLFYRYVQQFNQSEVAVQLNVSLRQYHRLKDRAIATLAAQLCEKYNLAISSASGSGPESTSPTPENILSTTQTIQNELAWLQNLPPGSAAEFAEVFTTVPRLIGPLAEQRGVTIRWDGSEILDGVIPARVAIHSMALKLLLVALLNAGIVQSDPGELVCSVSQQGSTLTLAISGASSLAAMTGEVGGFLETAQALTQLGNGKLSIAHTAGGFAIHMTLPTAGQRPVLVVDDNPDALQMFQRYLTDTPYTFIGSDNPEIALELALQHTPIAIVLDVMMPQLDGWELLGRIRSHPQTAQLPVLVCTILAQESLAESLGANALLRKPVTRANFLAALENCLSTQH